MPSAVKAAERSLWSSIKVENTSATPRDAHAAREQVNESARCIQGVIRGKDQRRDFATVPFNACQTAAIRLGTIAAHNNPDVAVLCFAAQNQNGRSCTYATTNSESIFEFGIGSLSSWHTGGGRHPA